MEKTEKIMRIDDYGRIQIPKDIRIHMGIKENSAFQVRIGRHDTIELVRVYPELEDTCADLMKLQDKVAKGDNGLDQATKDACNEAIRTALACLRTGRPVYQPACKPEEGETDDAKIEWLTRVLEHCDKTIQGLQFDSTVDVHNMLTAVSAYINGEYEKPGEDK